MIFSEKLTLLRKKSGWSQEDLADQMGVTRQSVSKWEGAQAIPDLEKILRLSDLFGVSTDYLLKDDMGAEPLPCPSPANGSEALRRITLEEADTFLTARASASRLISRAVSLCIVSPICLFVLIGASEAPGSGLAETTALGVGMVTLLALVASAAALFLLAGSRSAPFQYLEEAPFETEYGVSGMVKLRRAAYERTYTKSNIIGTCLCIVSVAPLFVGVAIGGENDLFWIFTLCIMLCIVSVGAGLFVRSGVIWASFEKLLQEGSYSQAQKQRQPLASAVALAYWLSATAAYLAYSLLTGDWERSWLVWVVAGVLYPAFIGVFNACGKRQN